MVNKRFSNNTVKIEHIKMVHSGMSFIATSINPIPFLSYKDISDDSQRDQAQPQFEGQLFASAAVYLFLKVGS